jgi:Protein of unknown function (DUF3999)
MQKVSGDLQMISVLRVFPLLAVLIWPTVGTAELQLNDFAYGFRIAAPEKTGLVKLVLPETIYRHLVRADGGDMRVFGMDGRVVPHLLRRPDAEENLTRTRVLPFSPIYSDAPPGMNRDVRIRTDAGGAVFIFSPPSAKGPDPPAPAYLIDIRPMENRLAALRLSWRRHQPDVLVKARLEASEDLTQWHSIAESLTLADIRHGDLRLENREITLAPVHTGFDYLKLSWQSGGDAITVEKVEGVPAPQHTSSPQWWVRAPYRSHPETPGGSMQFDSKGVFPVDRIDLKLSQENSLLTGTVLSRASERGVWRIHYRGPFYHLKIKDATLRNDPVMVSETTDRYWKLDIDNRQSGLGGSVPRLMLGGRSHALFFATERGGAYVLAFGSRKAVPLVPPPGLAEQVALEGAKVPIADMGRRIELGGPSRLQGPAADASGRMMSLSTLLLGCVLLLAFFAWWVVRRLLSRDTKFCL